MRRPFDRLTDDEVYMLSRALIESSYVFVMGDEKTDSRYSAEEIKTYDEAIAAIQNQYPREVEEDGFRCNPPTDNKIYCFTKNGEYEITRRFIFEYDVPKK